MTLGNAATARVRVIVWCKGCRYPGSARPRWLARYGAERSDARSAQAAGLLQMRHSGVDMVVSGTKGLRRVLNSRLLAVKKK